MYSYALAGYFKSSIMIKFSYPVPVGVIDHMSIAVTRDMSSMVPACKRNTYAITAIALSLLPVGTYRAPVCVWYKMLIYYVVPLLTVE